MSRENPITDAERVRRHDELVAFLREQDELGRDPYTVFEPRCWTKEDCISIGRGSRIDSFVKLEGGERLSIGRYVHIASFAHVGIGGGRTTLEDFSAIASGGKVISGSNDIDALTMSACAPKTMQRVKASTTTISRYAVVLTNAVVNPGVTLGEGAVLMPGSVATKDIPAWEIWGGVPAAFKRQRVVTYGVEQ